MSAPSELPPVEDLTTTCWRDDLWLQSYGLLSHLTALDYFSMSPFYDRSCNNEIARQRGMRLEQLPPGAPGTEYVLQDAQPPHLFVFRKQFRSLSGELAPLAYYYILDGTIYQAPTLHAALSSRMERCLWTIKSAFETLRDDLDGMGERAAEVQGAELLAELHRQDAVKQGKAPRLGREQHRRAERAVLAALLDHPLPKSSALDKAAAGAAVPAAVEPTAGEEAPPAGAPSAGVALSRQG